jgi:hypothetical protein
VKHALTGSALGLMATPLTCRDRETLTANIYQQQVREDFTDVPLDMLGRRYKAANMKISSPPLAPLALIITLSPLFAVITIQLSCPPLPDTSCLCGHFKTPY